MENIVTCIDGSIVSAAVCDAGLWASQRIGVPLKLLHVLDKSEYPTKVDLSGNIGLGSREHLLEELIKLDEKRGEIALENGKHMLEAAKSRAIDDGAKNVTTLQRHGSLAETLIELEPETRLFIMGRREEGHGSTANTIGSHLENVIRTVHRPILVALSNFTPPERFMIAFDGSATAKKALEMVAGSPLLKGLLCHVVMVCNATTDREVELNSVCERLVAEGFDVKKKILDGEVQSALKNYKNEHAIDLMVMGAYGHSRIRQFLVGSNTTKMVNLSDIPLLLLR